ncbi:MAG TPA: hypothetical protein VNA44_09740 [Burkholderiaceae bacterium]|nr:hypothetical protein [Burkholderiaceae bacterium]
MKSARSSRGFRVQAPLGRRVVVLQALEERRWVVLQERQWVVLQQAAEEQPLAVAGSALPAVKGARVAAAPSRIPSAKAIAMQNYNAATWDEIESCG